MSLSLPSLSSGIPFSAPLSPPRWMAHLIPTDLKKMFFWIDKATFIIQDTETRLLHFIFQTPRGHEEWVTKYNNEKIAEAFIDRAKTQTEEIKKFITNESGLFSPHFFIFKIEFSFYKEPTFDSLQKLCISISPSTAQETLQKLERYLEKSCDNQKKENIYRALQSIYLYKIRTLFNEFRLGTDRKINAPMLFDITIKIVNFSDYETLDNAIRLCIAENRAENFRLIFDRTQQPEKIILENISKYFNIAIELGCWEIGEYMLERGWDPNGVEIIADQTPPRVIFPLKSCLFTSSAKKDAGKKMPSLFLKLLQHGANPNSLLYDPITGLPLLIAEYCLFHQGKMAPIFRSFVVPLIKHGAKITPRMEEHMLDQLITTPEYGEVLIRHGGIEPAAIALRMKTDIPENTLESHTRNLLAGLDTMKKNLRTGQNKELLIDYAQIEKLKQRKKEAKEFSHKNESLSMLFQEYVGLYDQIVTSHFLLRELRSISQEFRTYTALPRRPFPSDRLFKTYSLWSGLDYNYHKGASKTILREIRTEERSVIWAAIRKKIINQASIAAKTPLWRGHYITLVHGTKLSPTLVKTKALLPKGLLNKEMIPPFSGEIQGNDQEVGGGFNHNHLSCSALSKAWSDPAEPDFFYFDASTRLLIALIFAQQIYGLGTNEKFFNREASARRVAWEEIERHLENEATDKLAICHMDILRLRSTIEDPQAYFTPLLQNIQAKLGANPSTYLFKQLQLLKKYVTHPLKYQLSTEDLRLLDKPIPILFASTNRRGQPYSEPVRPDNMKPGIDEYLIEGALEFGKHIQAAFVSTEDLAQTKQALDSSGVQVFDMDLAKYLEMEHMIRGSEEVAFKQAIDSLPRIHKEQKRISYYLKNEILPKYFTPFPERPTYRENNRMVYVDHPDYGDAMTYAEYIRLFQEGQITARGIHGPMHACRVAILSQMLRYLYLAAGSEEKTHPVLLAMTAGDHDGEREEGGLDRWEKKSAASLRNSLLALGIKESIANEYYHAIAEKDPHDGQFQTDIQRIVNSADCLEIIRVLPDLSHFDPKRLPCFNLKTFHKKIIKEWSQFIAITESKELQIHLEFHSESYYDDVMRILKVVGPKVCPTVYSHLRQELQYYDAEAPSFRTVLSFIA